MKRMVLGGALAGVLVLVGAWFWVAGQPTARDGGLPNAAAPASGMSVEPRGAEVAGGVTGPRASGAATVLGEAPTGRGDALPTAGGRPRLEDIQAELNALKAGGRTPQPAELDGVFEKLERYNGGSTMGGVDLRAVRKNLQAAARIQTLTEQMRPLAESPTPENLQKLQTLLADMRQAQSGMTSDMGAAPVLR
ncbi:hypothetical protein [Hydrogenophaga soli]